MNAERLARKAVQELQDAREAAAIQALKGSHENVENLERALKGAQEQHRALIKAINSDTFRPQPHYAPGRNNS